MRQVLVCPKCGHAGNSPFSDCPRCGIIVEKYLAMQEARKEGRGARGETAHGGAIFSRIHIPPVKQLLFDVPMDMHPFFFWGRAAVFVIIAIIGIRLMFSSIESNAVGASFLHNINIPFHEAGHVIFKFLRFGPFMISLGGTLGQLFMPLTCFFVFLLQTRDTFAAGVCLWWFGENFLDIAPYIHDARAGDLPLLGGNFGKSSPYGFHDWEFILGETGLQMFDHTIAKMSFSAGVIIMTVSYSWCGYLLWKQYHNLEEFD